jgi:RimJ/RimL family protein N-acetyltransferase
MRYMGQTRDREATLAWIQRAIEHQRRHGFGKWAVVERDTGEIVGHCGIAFLEDGPDVELGFCLARECWGRGYATEAGRAWLARGFELGFERIVAIVHPKNAASIRALEKIGFVPAGRSRYFGRNWLLYEARP